MRAAAVDARLETVAGPLHFDKRDPVATDLVPTTGDHPVTVFSVTVLDDPSLYLNRYALNSPTDANGRRCYLYLSATSQFSAGIPAVGAGYPVPGINILSATCGRGIPASARCSSTSSSPLLGVPLRLSIWDRELTAGERARVLGWLARRYGTPPPRLIAQLSHALTSGWRHEGRSSRLATTGCRWTTALRRTIASERHNDPDNAGSPGDDRLGRRRRNTGGRTRQVRPQLANGRHRTTSLRLDEPRRLILGRRGPTCTTESVCQYCRWLEHSHRCPGARDSGVDHGTQPRDPAPCLHLGPRTQCRRTDTRPGLAGQPLPLTGAAR